MTMFIAGAFAQKSYVNVVASYLESRYQSIHVTGDLPDGMKDYYDRYVESKTIGEVLNLLAKNGFEVESTSAAAGAEGFCVNYVLSKGASPNVPGAVERVVADDGEAHEVARYNLQGVPVGKNEKGVQIIVYSNYTSRVIVVE